MIDLPTDADPVRIIQGDCLDVLRQLPDGCVDAVVTDPPYGIDLRAASSGGRKGRRLRAGEYAVANDESQDVGLQVLQWCERLAMKTVMFASPRLPWPGEWDSWLVWDKGGAVGGGGDINRTWKPTWELIQVARIDKLRCGRDASVLRFAVTSRSFSEHPTAKPLALMRYLIRQLTDPGDLILDPFAGSGTTLAAAAIEGRRAIGVELDPAYCEIARRRVKHALGDGLLSLVPEPTPEARP